MSEEEAKKFLSCFKRSEYDIVEQLEKMPSKISSLCCLPLKATCWKCLNEAHVPKDVSVDKFQNLVGSILATNYITFTDEEMTPDGTGHVRPLYITVKCKDMIVARVIIYNGSALNHSDAI